MSTINKRPGYVCSIPAAKSVSLSEKTIGATRRNKTAHQKNWFRFAANAIYTTKRNVAHTIFVVGRHWSIKCYTYYEFTLYKWLTEGLYVWYTYLPKTWERFLFCIFCRFGHKTCTGPMLCTSADFVGARRYLPRPCNSRPYTIPKQPKQQQLPVYRFCQYLLFVHISLCFLFLQVPIFV